MDQKVLESDLYTLSLWGRLRLPPDDWSRDIHLFKSSSVLGNNKGKLFLNKTKDKGLIPTTGTQSQNSKAHTNLYEGKNEKRERSVHAAILRIVQLPNKNYTCTQITQEEDNIWQMVVVMDSRFFLNIL